MQVFTCSSNSVIRIRRTSLQYRSLSSYFSGTELPSQSTLINTIDPSLNVHDQLRGEDAKSAVDSDISSVSISFT
ncbi:hypothetical protein DPMN_089866 [Dreissena polymorpha]|uniref:Uncharacterized protein n=1 Tax=Dreissena polymorpha TaxID=45954 RepID=A0A9D4KZ33_DREPO|nr:hypothetical protein DPMN_089866 [Dreissena polymorpha]